MSTIWVRSLLWTLVLALICCLATAEEWSRFRGPNGSGVGTTTALPTQFSPDHHVTWKANVPFGRSSPVVSGRHIFLTGVEDGQLVVMALERSTGRLAWKRAVERVRDPEMYHGTDSATPTPVTDGSNRPEVVWRYKRNLPYIPTPVVHDGIVYLIKEGGILSSLDLLTGKLHKRGRVHKSAGEVYASPIIADGKLYIATLDGKVIVVQPGAKWKVSSVNKLDEEIHATPAVADGQLLVRTRERLYSFGPN